MAVFQEWDKHTGDINLKQDFNFQKHLFGKSRFIQRALRQFLFEKIRRIDLLWKIVKLNIGQVCFECSMFRNFFLIFISQGYIQKVNLFKFATFRTF
jgi:hypothetical protein